MAEAPRDLWKSLCDLKNLIQAYRKARKHKTQKPYVLDFEKNIIQKLTLLRTELLLHAYRPKPLETFILRDPKTRRISKSDFRDRVVHHALCTIIEPFFEKTFIFDSYANRQGKGTLKAIERFTYFQRRLAQNYTQPVFVLKADIRHYFDEVDHALLLQLIQAKVKDKRVLWLIKRILGNYATKEGQGMPLGNLTSQFFANVYLNELDQYVKHQLKAKYYLRYVDDFAILHSSRKQLEAYKQQIKQFLDEKLKLTLHPDKSRILLLHHGIEFLGFKIFPHHQQLKRKNLRKFQRKFTALCQQFNAQLIPYDDLYNYLEGWIAYAKNADTHHVRKKFLFRFNERFAGEISTKEFYRLRKEFSKPTCRSICSPKKSSPMTSSLVPASSPSFQTLLPLSAC